MSFHAQHGEDRWMHEHWHELGLPENGTYVEVGAHDGVFCSNTLWLHQKHGYTGLLVEPHPHTFKELKVNRPADLCVQVACTKHDGADTFYMHPDHPTWSGLLQADGEPVLMSTKRLSTLISRYSVPHVHFMSIDTEGTELDVWRGLSPEHRPDWLLVEWETQGLLDNRKILRKVLTTDGYTEVVEFEGNLLFKRGNHATGSAA